MREVICELWASASNNCSTKETYARYGGRGTRSRVLLFIVTHENEVRTEVRSSWFANTTSSEKK